MVDFHSLWGGNRDGNSRLTVNQKLLNFPVGEGYNPFHAKLYYQNFHPLEFVDRWIALCISDSA